MIKYIDDGYKNDVRHLVKSLTADDTRNVPKVVKVLTGVVRNRSANQPASGGGRGDIAHALKAYMAENNLQLVPVHKTNPAEKTACIHCGLFHLGPPSKCFAFLRSQGKPVPGWAGMPASQKERIEERAKAIAVKDGKELPKVACIQVQQVAPEIECLVEETARKYDTVPVYIDSQGGVGFKYHFIKDKCLFTTLDESAPSVKIGGVVGDASTASSKGLGTCHLTLVHGDRVLGVELRNCLYVPGMSANIWNTWYSANEHGVGAVLDAVDPRLEFADGDKFSLYGDYSVRAVVPSSVAVRQLDVSVITRGKHGAKHVDTKPLLEHERIEFEFAHQVLNEPAPDRAKNLHKVMDGAPPILQKSNYNNAATEGRLLANAPAMPSPAGGDHATRVGELTQIDGWDSQVVSYLGNRYMLACYDAYSTDFELYFAKKKSEFPNRVDRYFTEKLRQHGDFVELGGVLYSDNEPVLVSQDMEAVALKHNRTRETSVEYRATSNAGVESVFRTVPNEMRKIYVRTKIPFDLWEFVALEAQRILAATREHGKEHGKSVHEVSTGERPDYASFNRDSIGCLVVARLPVPWRQHKQVPRNIEGVNLGKSRSQPGWVLYNPEYGLMTSADVTFLHHIFPFKDGSIKFRAKHGGGGVFLGDEGDDDDWGMTPMVAPPPAAAPATADDDDDDDAVPGLIAPADDSDDDDDEGDAPAPAPAPAPAAPTGRVTRSAGVTHDITHFSDQAKRLSELPIRKVVLDVTGDEAVDNVTKAIEDHVARVMGTARPKSQDDPDWVPPPWFDLKSIRDPETRAKWMEPDLKEIEGVRDTSECIREVLYDDLTPEQQKEIIGSLTPRAVKRSGKKKSRVVARGDQMKQGIHYQRSHSPTLMHVSMRFLFALAAAMDLKVIGGDFSQAYLNAELDETEWYHMWPPKSARQHDEQGRRIVWQVVKSLYGGKNAGRNWYLKLRQFLLDKGFEQCYCEPCVFFKREGDKILVIGAYVDDLIFLASDDSDMADIIAEIQAKFAFTVQDPLVDMCGIEVTSTEKHIILSLSKYIDNLAHEFLSEEERATKVHVPCTTELPKLVEEALLQDPAHVNKSLIKLFQRLTGAVGFTCMTVRPEVAYAMGQLARAQSRPTPELLAAAKVVLQYLYHTKDLGIFYSRGSPLSFSGSSDADWGTRCSVSGYAFFMAMAVVSYLSKLQPVISMSSAQSEITSLSLASLEAVFLLGITEQVLGKELGPITIDVDSKAAADLAQDFMSNSRVRHFERRQLKVRELVSRALVAIRQVGTADNVSDIFTKALGRRAFEKHRRTLLNLPVRFQ